MKSGRFDVANAITVNKIKNGKPSGDPQPFLTGLVPDPSKSNVNGRPVGIAVAPDGSLLVSDDGAGNLSITLGTNESLAVVSKGTSYTFSANQSFIFASAGNATEAMRNTEAIHSATVMIDSVRTRLASRRITSAATRSPPTLCSY